MEVIPTMEHIERCRQLEELCDASVSPHGRWSGHRTNAEGHCCGFYEQSIGEIVDVMWSASVAPYGYQLLSPHRADRLVFAASNGQDFPSSVVLLQRPWDVVLLTQGGLEQAVYVSPLDPGEYHDRLDRFLMRIRKAIWPIRQSELNVEFLRNLFSLSVNPSGDWRSCSCQKANAFLNCFNVKAWLFLRRASMRRCQ